MIRELLIGLVVVWLAAKLVGEIMERFGQPPVLGELLAGVVVGPGVLGLVHETDLLHALAELGVILLLFEIGLESDLDELLRAGVQSTVSRTDVGRSARSGPRRGREPGCSCEGPLVGTGLLILSPSTTGIVGLDRPTLGAAHPY